MRRSWLIPPAALIWTAVAAAAEPVPPDGPTVRVAGTVTAPDGTPVGGATVVMRVKTGGAFYAFGLGHNRDVLARTTSDAAGRFAFAGVGLPPRLDDTIDSLMRGSGGAELVAWADGRALAWADVRRLTTDEPVRLTLPPEAPVTGVVRDEAGKGTAGVRIAVFGATRPSASNASSGFFNRPGDLNLTLSEVAPWNAATDADGRFALHHLPPGYWFLANFERAGMARATAYVETGGASGVVEIRTSYGSKSTFPVLRPPLAVTLKPERQTIVRVVDDAGRPVTDGGIEVIDTERYGAGRGTRDTHGQVHVALKPGRYEFEYGADPLAPRLCIGVKAEVAAGGDAPIVEIRLPAPRWLTGRVADADTGQGVVGAYVHYRQTVGVSPASATAVSGPGGAFRIPVATGRATLLVARPVHGYYPVAVHDRTADRRCVEEIDVPAAGDPKPVMLPLARGLGVRGRAIGPDGKPASGAVVLARNHDFPYRRATATADANGHFTLSGVSPYVRTTVTARADGCAVQATVEAAPDHPPLRTRWQDTNFVVERGVQVTGRALFAGKPRAGVVVTLYVQQNPREFPPEHAVGTTEADGRFRVGGLKAGDRFFFRVADPDGHQDPYWEPQEGRAATVPAGVRTVELLPMQLVAYGQTLKGIVVDPNGKPVAGATVTAAVVGLVGSKGQLPRIGDGPPPWAVTDAGGCFELRELPLQPLELSVFKGTPGQAIRIAGTVRPAINDAAVRLVFDPARP